tara:strand:- start:3266 stop:4039 length:774 start_codon:yes stop_codon:yes gene_type:complete
MYGNAPQDRGFAGGQRLTEGTQGLFGQGGQGNDQGLLTTVTDPSESNIGQFYSNPFIMGGLRAIQAGGMGQSASTALPGAAIGALKDVSLAEKYKDLMGKKKAKKSIQDSKLFSEKEKLMIQAGMKLPSSQATANIKNYNFFKKLPKTKENLMIMNSVLGKETKNEYLGKIQAAIAKNTYMPEAQRLKTMQEAESNWDRINGLIDDELGNKKNTFVSSANPPKWFSGTSDNWEVFRQANPSFTDEKLKKNIPKNFQK